MVLSKWWILFDVVYWVPSILMYMFLLKSFLAESKNNKPGQSFFKLIIVLGFVDISISVLISLGLRLPLSPLFSSSFCRLHFPVLLTFLHWFCYSLLGLQFYLNILISANRFTAIVLSTQHELFWKTSLRKLIIFGALFNACIYLDLLSKPTRFDPIVARNTTLCVWTNDDGNPTKVNSIRFGLISLVCAVVCLVLNALSMASFCRHRRRPSLQNTSARSGRPLSKVELNLLAISLLIFAFQMIAAVFQLYIHKLISSDDFAALSEAILYAPWVIDVSTLSSPWILIAISSNIRKTMFDSVHYLTLQGSQGHSSPTTKQTNCHQLIQSKTNDKALNS